MYYFLKKNYKNVISTLTLLVGIIIIIKLFGSSTNHNSNKDKFDEYFHNKYKVFSLTIPDNLSFVNEKVPVDRFDVREAMDREMLTNTYWQSQTLLIIKRANRYLPLIEPILKRNNIPDDFKYLSLIESSLTNVVSPAGASGFWQFLDKTAKQYKLEVTDEVDERYNLEKATEAACKYFKESYDTLKSWTLVAASYNMGITGIRKQIEKQKTNNFYDLYLNTETSRYIFRIIAMKLIVENPKNYGFLYRKKDLYPVLPINKVKVDSAISDLVYFAAKQNINYKIFRMLNPWLKKNFLTNKLKKTYYFDLPKEGYIYYSVLLKDLPEEYFKILDLPSDSAK